MKQLLAIALVCIANCAFAQKETIEGNGKLVTKDIPVTQFSEIKASGIYELKLVQGNKEAVRIEADENLQQYFSVKNDGKQLVIDMDKLKDKDLSFNTKNKMKVFVTFKTLSNMELKMIGNVVSEGNLALSDLTLKNKGVGNVSLEMTADKIDVENKGVGNITLKGKAEDAIMKNSGVGNLDAGDFVVQTITIENKGMGNAEVHAAKQLKVWDSHFGKVKNRGAAPVRKQNKVVI